MKNEVRNILFLCKTNQTLSVIAESILKQAKPTWNIASAATDNRFVGQYIDLDLQHILSYYRYPISSDAYSSRSVDDYLHMMHEIEIHDLTKEGIQDPLVTKAYREAIYDLEQYIKHVVIDE